MLRVRGLRVAVADRTLVHALDLDVETGASVAVVGPSGSGKTRLLRALAGLDPVAAGTMTLDDRSPDGWGWPAWRSRVVLVPQAVPVLPGTPRELHETVARLGTQRGRDGSDPALLATAWGLPASAFDQKWATLSGGEAQRALLAIALSRDPAVLLLDEPTGALDEAATDAVEAALTERACVFVTHDEAQAARLGARVVRVGGGA